LLTNDDIRDLVQKMVAEVLAYDPPRTNNYDEKRNMAQQLINALQRMTPTYKPMPPTRKVRWKRN
jgi:hypothetical protein